MKIMRLSIGERMLRGVYVCGKFLDRLFCRRKLWYIISNARLSSGVTELYRCNIHVQRPNVTS